jgi:hypothetical protein
MKGKRTAIYFISAAVIISALLAAVMIIRSQYEVYMIVNNEGYAVSRNDITKNLLNDAVTPGDADVEAVSFSLSDMIFERAGKLFIGEQKAPVNEIYPLFINDTSAIMTLNSDAVIVTEDFEFARSYKGLYISDGISFNQDMERAYREEFILLSMTNGLFINTKEITVEDNFFVEETIPVNSIIRFMENEIRFYSLRDSVYVLSSVRPLGSSTTLTIDSDTYKYYDFLEKLGLYEKEELRGQENDKPKDEEEPEPEDIPEPEGTSEARPDEKPKVTPADGTQRDRDTQASRDGTAIPPAGRPDEDEEDEEDIQQELPELSGIPPKPAEPAKLAELPDPIKPSAAGPGGDSYSPGPEPDPESEKPDKPGGNPLWEKPSVKLGAFTTTVYSIRSAGMTVDNAVYLHRSGIGFEVYDGSKLVSRKAYNDSANVYIGPLTPDKEYRVVVTMSYLDKYNKKQEEKITEATVRTKPFDELEPLRLNWSNGDIRFDKILLRDLSITNAYTGQAPAPGTESNIPAYEQYIETVQYLSRVEVVFEKTQSSMKAYNFAMTAKDLNEFKAGRPILYETMTRVESNSQYEYSFTLYDRFGNTLPLDGIVRGSSHTCKMPPKARISIVKNEVRNVELDIGFENTDAADIAENSIYFTVFDRENNPVISTAVMENEDGSYPSIGQTAQAHPIGIEGGSVKFLDLLDHEVYTIRVYCDYDINDGLGVYQYAAIGESNFTTMPLSVLGYAFFDVSVDKVTDKDAEIRVKFNRARTDSRLVALISELDVSFAEDETKDGSGIGISYSIDLKEPGGPVTGGPADGGRVILGPEETQKLKSAEDGSVVFTLENLKSITKYSIVIRPRVMMGNVNNAVYREVSAFYEPASFITMKKTPTVDIDAIYASTDFIKLYGVSVNDPDLAVAAYPVTVVVYDENNIQILSYELSSADKVSVISLNRLIKDKIYTIRFFASEFNNGHDRSTLRKNVELFYSKLAKDKESLKVTTRDAISGSIQLLKLNRDRINAAIDIPVTAIRSNNSRVTVYQNRRFGSNSQMHCKFSTEVDFGEGGWNGFQIGYSDARYSSTIFTTTVFRLYLTDPDTNPGAQPIATITAGETLGPEFCRWTDEQLIDGLSKITGVRTVYLTADKNGTDDAGIDCLWGMRFHKVQRSGSESFYADLNVNINDVNDELGSAPSYFVKIYKNNVWIDTRRHKWVSNGNGTYTLNMYQVAPDGRETLVDSKIYSGTANVCDTDFYYPVDSGFNKYRFDLWVNIFDYEMNLGTEEFTTEKEITAIRTEEDLRNIRFGVTKKYIVLNDIETTYNNNNFNASLHFLGELDFRGYTLTYNSTSALITYLGYSGVLKNLNLRYGEGWGEAVERMSYYIVTNNYGTISNVMITRNNGGVVNTHRTGMSALCSTNYEGGIIENFVINLKDPFIGSNSLAGVCVTNRGIIRNGYVYGQPLQRTDRSILTDVQNTETLYMGGVVRINQPGGIVENVYSSIDINTREVQTSSDCANLVVARNEGRARNSFSTGNVYYGGEIRQDMGPATRNIYSGAIRDIYYYSEHDYGNTDNKRVPLEILYDLEWYDRLFNSTEVTRPGQFELDPVKMGYYPHVVWPDCMPQQEFVPLPVLLPRDMVDILDANVTEQLDDSAIAVITFKNPQDLQIKKINVRWLNTEIISQDRIGDFYRVTVRLTQSAVTKYYSSYPVVSFEYALGFRDMTSKVEYEEEKEPVIPAEFYKPILTLTDWASMKDDITQNYRLEADLDFQGMPADVAVIPANVTLAVSNAAFKSDAFAGKLNGKGHTIRNINTADYGYVFGKLSGSIKNLTVENLRAIGDGRYKGFIGRMLEESTVDNVHILGFEAESIEHCGAIAGDARNAYIMNSSAHDLIIRTVPDGVYTQFVGGLVGKQRMDSTTILANISIMNCYVDTFSIDVLKAGDCGGVGGIVGFIRAGTEISHVYAVNGAINTVFRNVGGIIGTVDNRTSNATSYKLKDFYVDVDITTVTDRAGGVIGYAGTTNAMDKSNTSGDADSEDQEPVKPGCHGLLLGNVSTTKSDAVEVGYYFGYQEAEPVGIYRYENALLNGRQNPVSSVAEDILTFAQLSSPGSYGPGGHLDWDADFARDPDAIRMGIMPKLMDTKRQALLPYQSDFSIEQNLVRVTNITHVNYSNLHQIQITTQHAPEITVEGAKFNGLKTADLAEPDEAVQIIRSPEGTGTVLQYVVDLDGYYDAYYLTELNFTISGEDGTKSQLMHLNVGISPQFLEIGSADIWNDLMAVDRFGQRGFNIRITGDLDFSSFGGNAAKNVVVNHLTGSDMSDAGRKKIRRITLNGSESLIQTVNGNISYLDFEDITLTKTKADNPENINNFGIISQVIGDMHHTGFKRVRIEAYNSFYAGIAALTYSRNRDISLEDITVIGTYGTLPAKRAVGGLIGKLSGSGSVEGVTAEDIIVIGRGYTGGIVGTQEDGRSLWDIHVRNAAVSGQYTSSDSYVGGVIGYANTNIFSDRIGNISIDHAVVHGHSYVGGIVGVGNVPGDNEMTAAEKDGYRSQASRLFAAGSGALGGGITGAGMVQRADVRGSYIYSTNRIGGITGNGDTYFATCTDSVIGSVYDRDPTDTGNLRFRSTVTERRQYYIDLSAGTSDTSKKAVYDKAAEILGNLITNGRNTTWSTTNFASTNYSIGGIAGYALSMHNSIASNCRIGSFGATDVGGVSGQAAVSSYNHGPYRHVSSGSQNCYIYGASNVGGVTGNYMRGYMDSCYSSSTVEASVANAGGIAGYVKSASVSNLNETPRAVHVYFTGTVSAPSYAAGIFGRLDQALYGVNEGWLMGGTVNVTGMSSWGNFYVNQLSSDKAKVTRSMVYDDSAVNFQGGVSLKPSDYHDITVVTTAQLRDKNTYINGMGYSSDEGITSSNYSTCYWKYNGLSNDYMPYLTHAPYNNYNMSESIRILKNQEGYVLDEDTGKAMVDADGLYVYKYETYDGGIPIPGSGAGIITRMRMMKLPDEIPSASFYTVDADKLNIEFSNTHPGTSFRVYADGRLMAENPVSQRTFTLNYDFRSELKVTVTDGRSEESYEIWPEDVSRNIMTWGRDYYYITFDGAAGSRGMLYGNFVNLYSGHALDASGEVYDLDSGQVLRKFGGIGLDESVVPLYSFEYEDYKLETYKNYTIVNGVIRDQLRLYVKDNNLSAVSSKLAMVHDSIILDSFGEKEYMTALFNNGTITDMTDSPINMPRDFDNKGISYMTTNLGSTSHVLLVRYDDGAVAGFDYTTGEKLDIVSPRGTRTLLTDPDGIGLRSQRVSMTNFDTAYKEAMEFGKHLLDSGWAELNGDNITSGEEVSGDDGKVTQGGAGGTGGGNAGPASPSGTASPAGAAYNKGAAQPAGTADSKGSAQLSGSGQNADITGDNTVAGANGDSVNTDTTSGVPNAGATGEVPNTDTIGAVPNTGKTDEVPNTGITGDSPDAATGADAAGHNDGETAESGQEAEEASAADENTGKSTIGAIKTKVSAKEEKPRYIAVYDVQSSKYVLFDEKELLTLEDDKLEPMDAKVKKAGHMIEYRPKHRADIEDPSDGPIYGYLLLSAAIAGIVLLLGVMILKKQKEAV